MQPHKRPFNLHEFKIEVTYRCDLNCIHCSSDSRPSNLLEMSRADCLRILDEAGEMGAREVAFSGGEPLGWVRIFDAVDAAAKNNLRTTVYTSGNTEDFTTKAERLRSLGVSRLIFSLFGGTVATHERVTRTAGSFDRTQTAMRDAHRLGLTTELHFVPMSTNYRELGDVVSFGLEVGACAVSVLRLVPQGRAALLSGRALTKTQNLELRRQIRDLRKSGLKIRTGSPFNFLMLNEKPGCWAAIDRLIIGPDLRLYPCDAFKRIDAVELVKTEQWSSLQHWSLPECWKKSPYLEAVRTYLTTDFGAPCNSCSFLEKCMSGCLAQKVIAYSTLEKRPDPDCLGPHLEGDTV
jgi:radical SAM protein with 4Fe4S-binding SPASM domain